MIVSKARVERRKRPAYLHNCLGTNKNAPTGGNPVITQTIEVPADHRVFFEFVAPQEIPAGKAKVEVKLTPVVEKHTNQRHDTALKNTNGWAAPHTDTLSEILSRPTPRADALSGILSGLGGITLEQIREERLAKYLE